MFSLKTNLPVMKLVEKIETYIKYPECYNTDLYKLGKYKNSNQRYLCKKYSRQFTLQSSKKYLHKYAKCPIFDKGSYLNHRYKYHINFKYNDKNYKYTFKQIIPTVIDDPSSENPNGKARFSSHRYNLNNIILSINLYYSLNATTRAIST